MLNLPLQGFTEFIKSLCRNCRYDNLAASINTRDVDNHVLNSIKTTIFKEEDVTKKFSFFVQDEEFHVSISNNYSEFNIRIYTEENHTIIRLYFQVEMPNSKRTFKVETNESLHFLITRESNGTESIEYNDGEYINCIEVPNITEEQYFQMSTVHDIHVPFEVLDFVQNNPYLPELMELKCNLYFRQYSDMNDVMNGFAEALDAYASSEVQGQV